MEHQVFERVSSLKIIICRQCQHGVRPQEVTQHLLSKHQMKQADAVMITNAIQGWEDIEQDSNAISIPSALNDPLPILPCEASGLLYQQDYPQCQYVVSCMKTMQQHWQTKHQWTQQRRRGQVRRTDQIQSTAELHQSFQCVSWQQVFPSGPGSHYVRIRFPEGPSQQPNPAPAQHAQAAVDEVLQAWEQAQAQAKAQQTVQAGELTDANPWLRMTGWADYLHGISKKNLLNCINTPEDEPPDATKQRVQVI